MNEINFSAMRHRVTLMRAVDTPGPGGTATRAWQAIDDGWAEIRPLNARDRRRHGRTAMDVTHTVRLRYRDDWRRAGRILLGARDFRVTGVIDVAESRRILEFSVMEVTSREDGQS